MQGKDMSLKKNSILFFFIIAISILFSKKILANLENELALIEYLNKLDNFSVFFVQSDGINISEGKISISKNRIRVDYLLPSKILIILDKNKAMYYNHDLDEDEFFDPKDTSAWFFFEVFNNKLFLQEAEFSLENNNIVLTKKGFNNDEEYVLKIYFENNPLIIRKISLEVSDTLIDLSFFNHNYNETFDEKAFKLINPSFFD